MCKYKVEDDKKGDFFEHRRHAVSINVQCLAQHPLVFNHHLVTQS